MNHNSQLQKVDAEVFIERGQTEQKIDILFEQLKNNGMILTWIRSFESYMRLAGWRWNLSLFDKAFATGDT